MKPPLVLRSKLHDLLYRTPLKKTKNPNTKTLDPDSCSCLQLSFSIPFYWNIKTRAIPIRSYVQGKERHAGDLYQMQAEQG